MPELIIQKAGSASDVITKNNNRTVYGNILGQELAAQAGIITRVTRQSGGGGSSSSRNISAIGGSIFTYAERTTVVNTIIANTATNAASAAALTAAANSIGLTVISPLARIAVLLPWTPIYATGLRVWYDSVDPNGTGVPPANGTTITSWKDKSTNALHATAVGSVTYNSAGGLNMSSTYFNLATGTLPFGNNAFTYFFVINPSTISSIYIAGIGTTNSPGQCLALQMRTSDIDWFSPDLTTTVPPANQITILTLSWNPTTGVRSFRNNLNTAATGSIGSLSYLSSPQQIGAFNGGTPFQGKMHDVIAFSSVLTTEQQEQVEGYLAWKWGLQISDAGDFNPIIKLLLETDTLNTGSTSATRPSTNTGSVTVGTNVGKLSATFSSGKFITVPFTGIAIAPFSISYWFNPADGGDYDPWSLIFNGGWAINPDILNGNQSFYIKLGGVNTTGPAFTFTPASGGWNHVTLTINHTATTFGVAKSYLNSVLKGTVTGTTVGTLPNAQDLHLGKGDGRIYNGRIRRFRVHDFVLSQEQITSLYTQEINLLPDTHPYASAAPTIAV